ncbi:hypothetical protein AB3S75_000720 [Citrus x aurantiifolia]
MPMSAVTACACDENPGRICPISRSVQLFTQRASVSEKLEERRVNSTSLSSSTNKCISPYAHNHMVESLI